MSSLRKSLQTLCLTGVMCFQLPVLSATFSISGSNGGGGISGCGSAPSYSFTSETLQNSGLMTGSGSPGHCVVAFNARAGEGSVGVETEFGVDAGSPVAIGRSSASASATFEFMVTPPTGFSGNEIPLSVSTIFDGRLTAEIQTLSPFSRSAGGFLEARLDISGSRQATVGPGPLTVKQSVTSLESIAVSNTDKSAFRNISNLLTTPTIIIDPSLPVFVTLSLNGRSAIGSYGDAAHTKSDSWNSLSFISTGEVFNLPEGFSISSIEANVIDNIWLGAVPLPAGLPLIMAALGVLGYCNKRRPTV